jgi:5'-nucleotidase (lipoprotein e(P4) family)
MIAAIRSHSQRVGLVALTVIVIVALGCATQQPPVSAPIAAQAPEPPASELLNAVLWMQRSVEYKASALTAFALARIRLDQAMADKDWTAAPKEQTGAYQSLPPAIVLDVDESILDNSGYQAWMTLKGTTFDSKTWNAYVNTVTSQAIPGAVEFARYADSKGVKVFYVSNRTADEETATRKNLEKFGFPMGGNVDTMLMTRKQPDWGSAKGTRRAFVARSYRILINVGDNFGDFVDDYRGGEAERLKVMEDNKARWGREWIMIANPSYGSFESAPYRHDFKLSDAEKRTLKRGVLDAWPGP